MHTDSSSSDQFHVVTVSDTGRNWSDQEVQALIQVWSDERVCRQLETSTRKKDIFVQISNRLMQQGIERDWKQCHTKYKNLKYLYRSLQKGKTDDADPRRIMKFYDEVDAIMNQIANGSLDETGPADSRHVGRLIEVDGCEEKKDPVAIFLSNTDTPVATVPDYRNDSISILSHNVTTQTEEARIFKTKGQHLEQHHQLMNTSETNDGKDKNSNRGTKRKAPDQGLRSHRLSHDEHN